jgi:hypothetical protein
MTKFDDAWAAEQRRRWMRPDAWRYIRHDAFRFMPPGSPLYVGKDVVRYFWPEAEAQKPRPATALAPIPEGDDEAPICPRELASLRYEFAALRMQFALLKLAHLHRTALHPPHYNPEQPRVPAGNPDGGQWTRIDGAAIAEQDPQEGSQLAQGGFGRLVVELPRGGGRECVYNFGAINVIVPGPKNFRCPDRAHWSAVTHGRLLNDN